MAEVYVSGVVDVPVEEFWAYARDFNGHHEWHPIIAESEIEDGKPSDQIGCVRNFSLTNGGRLRERLLAMSDRERYFMYEIIVSPMPIENYVATFQCKPITEGNATFVEWSASFDVARENLEAIREQVGQNTFAAGIRALSKRLTGK